MVRIVFFLLLALVSMSAHAQKNVGRISLSSHTYSEKISKPSVDSSAYERWTRVQGASITNNGEYVSYAIKNDSLKSGTTNVLTDIHAKWVRKIPDVTSITFTADSKNAVFTASDTLFILKLGTSDLEKVPMVSIAIVPDKGSGEWIAFKYNSSDNLILYNLRSAVKRIYSSVERYSFNEDGNNLVLLIRDSTVGKQILKLFDLSTGKESRVWTGNGLINMRLNSSATQGALVILDKDGRNKSIWFYDYKEGNAKFLVDNKSLKDSSLVLDDLSRISVSGQYISFSVRRSNQVSPNLQAPSSTLNIWSYFDTKLQSIQLADGEGFSTYLFVIDRKNGSITQLCKDYENVASVNNDEDVYVIEHMAGDADGLESYWNSSAQRTFYLKSLSSKIDIPLDLNGSQMNFLSPTGKYMVFYDQTKLGYISYEVASGTYRGITKGINVSWNNSYDEDRGVTARGICGWLTNDDWLLIYDKFDIWMVDPKNEKKAVNITNGYGLRNSIVFYLGLSGSSCQTFSNQDLLILNGLNMQTKQNGYFRKKIDTPGDPELLTIGDCIYQLIQNPYLDENGIYPIRAKDANRYVVLRMKSDESPNYFFTSDFTNFKQLSYAYPERKYNWYKTELHTWKKNDGTTGQGILYKPENFDSTRKYPVIFHYYEKKSFSLNEYLFPQKIVSGCNIDIPTFVSNGYLVFRPDIDYVIGDPMQGTLDALVSAANYVSELPFVERTRMGIGGCSFGGTQTNYIVTHSGLFAAAYSASSMSDFVSAYNDVPSRYRSIQCYFEGGGQGRMQGSLWQSPDMYIKNSPIFSADKVTTPLLMMHTTHDGMSSFSQALEFFTALRRLGKRVWLLEYTEGNHGISGKSADDYAQRLNQFFDHYLKGKAAPQWMIRGIPARLKGIDNGFRLDSSIATPGRGLFIGTSDH
jgi:dipeptidyl aminopeptidase/acylaminoacyl peptidase